jgi:CRP-like cAMP-binding protein
MFLVVEGLAARIRHLADGTRHVVAFAEPGDLLGLTHWDMQHAETVEASWRFAYCATPIEAAAARLRGDPEIAFALVAEALRQNRRMEDLFVRRAHMPSHRILAGFLLHLDRLMGCSPDGAVHLPMLRADIADHLGFSVETASRAFSRLRDLGLAQPVNRSDVRIVDRAGLAVLAAEAGFDASSNHLGLPEQDGSFALR